MSDQFRYVNRNPFPIYLPTPRGGQALFRTSEWTTQAWFSRFVGRGQLTKELITEVQLRTKDVMSPATQQIAHPPLKVDTPPAPKKIEPSFVDETHQNYSVSNGVLACKLCETFRTGSTELMLYHLTDYHGIHDAVVAGHKRMPEKEEETVRTTMPVTTPPPASVPNAKEPEVSGPQQDPPQGNEAKAEAHACAVPGCGKTFGTTKGLSLHMLRMHKGTAPVTPA